MRGLSPLHAAFGRVRALWGVFHSDVRSACERSQVPLLLLQQRALHWACSDTARWHGNNRNTRLSKRTSEPHLPSLSPPPAIPRGQSLFLFSWVIFFFRETNLWNCEHEHVYHILYLKMSNKITCFILVGAGRSAYLYYCPVMLLFYLSDVLSILAIFQSF